VHKIDFKKTLKALYGPSTMAFSIVDVPAMQFVMVDGEGDPNTAASYATGLSWLYSTSYALKFASKRRGHDYTVPPLEALWWADDMSDFVARRKDRWRWTQMLMAPDFVPDEMFSAALAGARKKLGEPPASLRLEMFAEGLSVQIMHIGSYDDEAPTIRRLHEEFLPQNDLVENGHHHEIYISDPRKTAPTRLKTVLRQPVRKR
jgi:hypothetical protein